jgi:hypothetical protein
MILRNRQVARQEYWSVQCVHPTRLGYTPVQTSQVAIPRSLSPWQKCAEPPYYRRLFASQVHMPSNRLEGPGISDRP